MLSALDAIAGADLAFLDDAEIKAGAAMCDQPVSLPAMRRRRTSKAIILEELEDWIDQPVPPPLAETGVRSAPITPIE